MAKEVRLTVTPEKRDEIRRSINWDRLRAMADDEIDQAIGDDPDTAPLTEAEGMALRLQSIRKRMNLSQSRFADRFHIPVATLRDWEQARRQPDAAVWAYIQVIDHEPDAVLRALTAA
jgi:putative transcriptional regulator